MTPVPARTLRAQADEWFKQRNRLPTRELVREDEILFAASRYFAEHGRHAIVFGNLALALRMDPRTLRRFFTDLDAVFNEILTRHLRAIIDAFNALPFSTPNRLEALREAYRSVTRGNLNCPTHTHYLLIQQRHLLPPDLLQPIESSLDAIARVLDPAQPELALHLMDNPMITSAHAAALLALPQPGQQPSAPESAAHPPEPEILRPADPPEPHPEHAVPPNRAAKSKIRHKEPYPAPTIPLSTWPPPPLNAEIPPARAGP